MPHPVINQDNCKGCSLCVISCPSKCLEIDTSKINKMGLNPVDYTGEGCTGCGICFYTCPEPFAIMVIKEDE